MSDHGQQIEKEKMTAVFAFVFDDKAVVATDTLRVDPSGLLPDRTVQKSYCFKGLIPFGGAGTGAYLEKVADLMVFNESRHTRDRAGFLAAFEEARVAILEILRADPDPKKMAAAHFTVLAAIPASATPAEILRLDFHSGKVTQEPTPFAAEGTMVEAFTGIAETVLATWASPVLESDALALECVRQALALCPQHVGWPMDLRVSDGRPDGAAYQIRLDPRIPPGFMTLTAPT